MSESEKTGKWLYVDLPVTDYVEAWEFQKELAAARADGRIDRNIVLALEHPGVFTIGRRGGRQSLKVTDEFLKEAGAPVIEVERGGDITYHGPGQIVIYPIVNLEAAKLQIGEFITMLEEVMLKTAAAWGVTAERNSLNRGVWVGNNKMGSIGICVRRGVSFHGLSLNVNLSLDPFEWIRPCGLRGIGMTSLERELARKLPMDEVRKTIMRGIEEVFQVELIQTDLSELKSLFESADEPNPDAAGRDDAPPYSQSKGAGK